jgi:hypothetical protein
MRVLPEISRWGDQLRSAGEWLYAETCAHAVLGYDSPRLKDKLDQYSFALLPATLCAAYELDGDSRMLEKAETLFSKYRDQFPAGRKRCVQASNHTVLSALYLHEITGHDSYREHALEEVRFLLDGCRLTRNAAAGTFTDDGRVTAFSRHCYGTWALMEMHAVAPSAEYVEAASCSLSWWRGVQRESGLFPFFYDARQECWINTTTYAVHQKGMLLLSAWDIDAERQGAYEEMIRRAMAACDTRQWLYRSPQGWQAYRRSNRQPDVLYAYELGWQVLGHALGVRRSALCG